MIPLDTNVGSEPLRNSPAESVIEWIDKQSLQTLYPSAMTVAELHAGVTLCRLASVAGCRRGLDMFHS